MSGDSKIGSVGGVARTGPLRRVVGEATASARAPAQVRPASDNLPAARLTRLANNLADQPPPVDVARVAALRTAIGTGNYGVHPAIIASAMLDFHGRGTD
ncbi:flagellar biosynthesis anti-sigma factor FlgM [Sphingopyxis alaskensis]|uniref:flagellar biosynthesis anti-sigma factor FlgM n=1 Tax=Sphingopyxis alaskensis TaxID=117207 RepID=UPI00391875C1